MVNYRAGIVRVKEKLIGIIISGSPLLKNVCTSENSHQYRTNANIKNSSFV
jgi:hypothetical protein